MAVIALMVLAAGAVPARAGAFFSCHKKEDFKNANKFLGDEILDKRSRQRATIMKSFIDAQTEDIQASGTNLQSREQIQRILAACKADLEAELAALRASDPNGDGAEEDRLRENALLSDLQDLAAISGNLNI